MTLIPKRDRREPTTERQAERLRCKTDLKYLARMLLEDRFPGSIFNDEPHGRMCDFFVKKDPSYVYFKDFAQHYDGPKDRIIMVPRKARKSTVKVIDNIQWLLCWPDISILTLTAERELSAAFVEEFCSYFIVRGGERSSKSGDVIHGDPTSFQGLFPEFSITEKEATAKKFVSPARKKFSKEPTIGSLSIGSSGSGWSCDILDLDDVLSDDNTETGEQLDKLEKRISMAVNLKKKWGFRHIVGTRYNVSDAYGNLAERNGITELYGDFQNRDVSYMCKPAWWLRREGRDDAESQPYKQPDYKTWTPKEEEVDLFFPEELTFSVLAKQLRESPETFMCLPATAPILMSDWSEKPISEVKVGDEVVGYTVNDEEKGKRYSSLQRATVVDTFKYHGPIVKATTSSGRSVWCTPNHKWFKPTHRCDHGKWYKEISLGSKLVSVYKPMPPQSEEEQRDLDWLGGMMDGEGCCSGSLKVNQSGKANPEVSQAIRDVLTRLGFSFKFHGPVSFTIHGGRSSRLRLLQYARMFKLKRFHDSLWKDSRRIAERLSGQSAIEEVVSIEFAGECDVYSMETTTGNYVAYGFASKNSQQLNDPVGASGAVFTEQFVKSCFVDHTALPPSGTIFQFWDLAYGTKKHHDNRVGVTGLLDSWGRWWITNITRGKFSPNELPFKIVEDISVFRPRRTGIEDSMGAKWLEPEMQRWAKELNVSLNLDWVTILKGRSTGDAKRDRMETLQNPMAQKRLYFLNTLDCCDALVKEFRNVGNSKARNDIPDAISRLVETYSTTTNRLLSTSEPAGDDRVFREIGEREFHNIVFCKGKYEQSNEPPPAVVTKQEEEYEYDPVTGMPC